MQTELAAIPVCISCSSSFSPCFLWLQPAIQAHCHEKEQELGTGMAAKSYQRCHQTRCLSSDRKLIIRLAHRTTACDPRTFLLAKLSVSMYKQVSGLSLTLLG